MALTECGKMYVWGRGSYGRLGLGSTKTHNQPAEVRAGGKVGCLAGGGEEHFGEVEGSRG